MDLTESIAPKSDQWNQSMLDLDLPARIAITEDDE